MKKSSSRRSSGSSVTGKAGDRRRHPRSASRTAKKTSASSKASAELEAAPSLLPSPECCAHCANPMGPGDRALFVEEEVGRSFCSEDCIGGYFAHEVERLEADYQQRLSSSDLNTSEREKLAHLRWPTLREPDEVWREKTLSGDYRYTLISQFHNDKPVWCVCISLFLKGEPSFLFMSVLTRNAALVEHYRRGERMSWVKRNASEKNIGQSVDFSPEQQALDGTVIPESDPDLMEAAGFSTAPADGLALDGWSVEESLRATSSGERSADDIPPEEFAAYQSCLEETLQGPDELWSLEASNEEEDVRLYHFIKHYADEDGFWYLIIAREVPATDAEEEHLEVLDAFPTRDAELVGRYRQGQQELENAIEEPVSTARVLH